MISHTLSRTLLLGALIAPGATAQTMLNDYQARAAFLLNLAKFVEWPQEAFKSPSDPIALCVLGQNPFGRVLEDAAKGKVIEGRMFVVRQLSGVDQASACQILFISASERKRLRSILGDPKMGGILTVGELERFTAEGGVVNLKLDGGAIHLEINLHAAEQGKLRISSKLLNLAQIVRK